MYAAGPLKDKGSGPDSQQIGAVREFNRFYTRQLGLLNRDFLTSEWTLTEVRVPRVVREERAGRRIEVGHDLRGSRAA